LGAKASEPPEWQHSARWAVHVKITCSEPAAIVLFGPTVKRETRVWSFVFGGGVYVRYRWLLVSKFGSRAMPMSPFSWTLETGIWSAVVTCPLAGL